MQITRVITRDWYTGASLYATAYDSANAVLVARAQMAESPAGSGCYYLTVAGWDLDWVGRVVFDDGSLYESSPFDTAAIAAAVWSDAATYATDTNLAGLTTSAIAAAVWGSGTRTLTALAAGIVSGILSANVVQIGGDTNSVVSLVDNIGLLDAPISNLPAAVWGNGTRTITGGATSINDAETFIEESEIFN